MPDVAPGSGSYNCGMSDVRTAITPPADRRVAGFGIGGRWVEALAHRDFAGMETCLAEHVRFRGLMPARDIDVAGPSEVMAWFARWFGVADEDFEVVDATVGEVGPRLYLRWRVRLTSTTSGHVRVVEQHAYVEGTEHIDSMRVLCSGFVTDPPA
jgi:hypothetical protein